MKLRMKCKAIIFSTQLQINLCFMYFVYITNISQYIVFFYYNENMFSFTIDYTQMLFIIYEQIVKAFIYAHNTHTGNV